MYDSSRRLRQRFIDDVYDFVSKAMNQAQNVEDGGIRCPYVKCICENILQPSYVRAHLLRNGFQPNYIVWFYHGEERSNQSIQNYASTNYDIMN